MSDVERDPAASLGSHGEPIGWQGTDEYGRPSGFLSWRDGETRWPKSQSVPLYLRPQPTLTDEEREAISDAIYLCGATAGMSSEQGSATAWATCAATLRGLLERTN